MNNNNPKLTITMTGRRPVEIIKADWPVIASADGHSGQHACQANEEWRILARQHADGRAIVYAVRESGPGGMHAGYSGKRTGELLTEKDDIPAAIQRIGEACGIPESEIDHCIADLPAEEL